MSTSRGTGPIHAVSLPDDRDHVHPIASMLSKEIIATATVADNENETWIAPTIAFSPSRGWRC